MGHRVRSPCALTLSTMYRPVTPPHHRRAPEPGGCFPPLVAMISDVTDRALRGAAHELERVTSALHSHYGHLSPCIPIASVYFCCPSPRLSGSPRIAQPAHESLLRVPSQGTGRSPLMPEPCHSSLPLPLHTTARLSLAARLNLSTLCTFAAHRLASQAPTWRYPRGHRYCFRPPQSLPTTSHAAPFGTQRATRRACSRLYLGLAA